MGGEDQQGQQGHGYRRDRRGHCTNTSMPLRSNTRRKGGGETGHGTRSPLGRLLCLCCPTLALLPAPCPGPCFPLLGPCVVTRPEGRPRARSRTRACVGEENAVRIPCSCALVRRVMSCDVMCRPASWSRFNVSRTLSRPRSSVVCRLLRLSSTLESLIPDPMSSY